MKKQQINYLTESYKLMNIVCMSSLFSHPAIRFILKVLCIITISWLFLSIFLLQVSSILKDIKVVKSDTFEIYLKGAIQNPTALWKSSELNENNKKYVKAILDMELAIGLLDIYDAPKEIKKSYEDRLIYLKSID